MFTPAAVAGAMARWLGVGGPDDGDGVRVLDPACGDGGLLVAACEARRRAGWSVARALGACEGWDLDPLAVAAARLTLVGWALDHADAEADPPAPLALHQGDALAVDGPGSEVAGGGGSWEGAVPWVLANPPFLEAKRMARAAPGLRRRLRERFPQLTGAFDLYLAFAWRLRELIGESGRATVLLPNKVLQGRYAAPFREVVTGAGLTRIVDLSTTRPRVFPGTGVYPVVLSFSNREQGPVLGARYNRYDAEGLPEPSWQPVAPASYRHAAAEVPWFVPRPTWPILEPLFHRGQRLGEVAMVRTTCSFHAKGLRERFVKSEQVAEPAMRYLGGRSRARRTEVDLFQVRWDGFWLHYDERSLREEHRNPLPPRSLFERPKLVFCQHGRRMRLFVDDEGRFATKDVYPIAWPSDPRWTLDGLAAVMASTVFTALYNQVFHGVVCGGETYHYLPAFLRTVPVPAWSEELAAAGDRARSVQAGGGAEADPEGLLALDRAVARAYGICEQDRDRLARDWLDRVGASSPSAATAI